MVSFPALAEAWVMLTTAVPGDSYVVAFWVVLQSLLGKQVITKKRTA